MSAMQVAALARAGGVGVETVRYYQRRGLLKTPPQPPGGGARGGVRRYDDADVRRLRFIRSAQGAGFTLEEIAELLRLDATRDRARIRAMAAERITALDVKITDLTAARAALQDLATNCDAASAGPCPIVMAFGSPAQGRIDIVELAI